MRYGRRRLRRIRLIMSIVQTLSQIVFSGGSMMRLLAQPIQAHIECSLTVVNAYDAGSIHSGYTRAMKRGELTGR